MQVKYKTYDIGIDMWMIYNMFMDWHSSKLFKFY